MTIQPLAPLTGVPLPRPSTDLWLSPGLRRSEEAGSEARGADPTGVEADRELIGSGLRSPCLARAERSRPVTFALPFAVDLIVALACVAALCWASIAYSPPPDRWLPHASAVSSSLEAARRALPPRERDEEDALPDDFTSADATGRD